MTPSVVPVERLSSVCDDPIGLCGIGQPQQAEQQKQKELLWHKYPLGPDIDGSTWRTYGCIATASLLQAHSKGLYCMVAGMIQTFNCQGKQLADSRNSC